MTAKRYILNMDDEIRNCFIIGSCVLLCVVVSLGLRFINSRCNRIEYDEV